MKSIALFLIFCFASISCQKEKAPLTTASAAETTIATMSRADAEALVKQQWEKMLETLRKDRATEMESKEITLGDKKMRFLQREVGEAPEGGRALVISLHGGGSAAPQVNDGQWQNQIRLYDPEGSLYIAPRAPTNTWNLWHEGHIDGLFDRLIANCIAIHGINPDKVYVMGYSAGGDGVYQIGPRMADRWAAASMMAGHPNEAKPLNLRNVPFSLQVGGKDAAFKRNEICQQWAEKLDTLEKENPGSYVHFFKSYPEFGHWMNRQDAVAVPWMLKYSRQPWPKAVTWYQDDVLSPRMYWLAVDPAQVKAGQLIEARCEGQHIAIKSADVMKLTLRLSDALLNLDEEVRVTWNDKEVFSGKVARSAEAIEKSLAERADPSTIATALLEVSAPK